MFAPSSTFCPRFRPWRNEAGPEHAMMQEVGDPLRVLDIGLPARDRLQVPGAHDWESEGAFEKVVNRLPIGACALHGHVSPACSRQPVSQLKKRPRRRAEAPRFPSELSPLAGSEQAGNDRLLVGGQSPAAFVCGLHAIGLLMRCDRREGALDSETASRALPKKATDGCARGAPGSDC